MDGTVYWITGLSGAGKTSIGRKLYHKLKETKANVVLLDGDMLREVFGGDLGYTLEDRRMSAARNSKICHMLARQGIDVVCCTISMFEHIRQWNRTHNENYIEIYLKVPMDVLKARNQKNLYVDAKSELVGLGVGMEEPVQPDMVMINDGTLTMDELFDRVWKGIGENHEEDHLHAESGIC